MIKDILNQNENISPISQQLEVLKEHFPACFRADGSFDIARFKEDISDKTDVVQDGYELKFLGKSYAKLLASTDTTTVIQPNEAHNSLPENANSENIYISGDNLDGLKHLLKSYSKSIKCIYIDPPYNTGSDGFVYADNFNYTRETLQEKLSISEEEAERILYLTKRGSASHSAWLMFMYCRLLLARDLLTNDGVIFISIDDNEQANLKLLCDDVFGEENFVAQIVWERAFAPVNLKKHFSESHDYILCYSKKLEILESRGLKRKDDDRYKNPDRDPRGVWASSDMTVGPVVTDKVYEITTPSGRKLLPTNGRCWLFTQIRYQEMLEDNRIWFGEDGSNTPRVKKFLTEVKEGITPMTIWKYTDVGHSQDAAQRLKELFDGKDLFDYPKSIPLITRMIQLYCQDNDIILDFFSGSATTAHAVIQLNAVDGGNRKIIAVQLPEILSQDVDSQKIAYEFLKENNLPTTLDYIGIERIKRAAAKIKQENPGKELDLGFKHYILAEPNQNTLDRLESFDKAGLLADTTLLDDFGKPTILATWLNADGYGLTAKAEAIDLAGYTAYHHHKHLYLIDSGFTLESMKALLGRYDAEGKFNPENMVLFGYSFPDWSINEMLEKNLRILNDSDKNLKINFSVRY